MAPSCYPRSSADCSCCICGGPHRVGPWGLPAQTLSHVEAMSSPPTPAQTPQRSPPSPPTHRLSAHLNHTETLSTSLGAHMLHHAGLRASSMEPSWVAPGLTTLLAREFPPHRVPDGPLACCHVRPDAPSHPTPEARGSQLCLGTRGFPWGRLLNTQALGPRPPSSGFSELGGRGTCIFSAGGTCCKAVTRRPPKEGVGLFSCY